MIDIRPLDVPGPEDPQPGDPAPEVVHEPRPAADLMEVDPRIISANYQLEVEATEFLPGDVAPENMALEDRNG